MSNAVENTKPLITSFDTKRMTLPSFRTPSRNMIAPTNSVRVNMARIGSVSELRPPSASAVTRANAFVRATIVSDVLPVSEALMVVVIPV